MRPVLDTPGGNTRGSAVSRGVVGSRDWGADAFPVESSWFLATFGPDERPESHPGMRKHRTDGGTAKSTQPPSSSHLLSKGR